MGQNKSRARALDLSRCQTHKLDKLDRPDRPRPGDDLLRRVRIPVAQQRAETSDAIAQLAEIFKMTRRGVLAKASATQLRAMSTGESSQRGSPDNALLTKQGKA